MRTTKKNSLELTRELSTNGGVFHCHDNNIYAFAKYTFGPDMRQKGAF